MDWGVDRKPKRLSMGTKLGLLGVTLLLAGFGYVLYRKVEQNNALGNGLLTAAEEPATTPVTPPDETSAQPQELPPISFDPTELPQPIHQASHEVPVAESDAFGSSASTVIARNAETNPLADASHENPPEFQPAVPVENNSVDWTGVNSTTANIEATPPAPTGIESPPPSPTPTTPGPAESTVENPFGNVEISGPPESVETVTATPMPVESVPVVETIPVESVDSEAASVAMEFVPAPTAPTPSVSESTSVSETAETTPPPSFDFAPAPTDAVAETPSEEVVAAPAPVADVEATAPPEFSEPPMAIVESSEIPVAVEPTPEAVPNFEPSKTVMDASAAVPTVPFPSEPEATAEIPVGATQTGDTPAAEPAVFETETPFGTSEDSSESAAEVVPVAPQPETVAVPPPPTETESVPAAPDPFAKTDPFAADATAEPGTNEVVVEPTPAVPLQPVEPNLEPVPTVMEEPTTPPAPFAETPQDAEPVPFAENIPFEAEPAPAAVEEPTNPGAPTIPSERAAAELFGPVESNPNAASVNGTAPAMIDVPAPSPNSIRQMGGDADTAAQNVFEQNNPFAADAANPPTASATPMETSNTGTPAAQMSMDYEPDLVPVPSSNAPNVFQPDADSFKADEVDVYEVQSRDNYWSISKRVYGTGRYFTALARFNRTRIPDPRKMRPGMKVLVPTREVLEQANPDLFPKRVLNTDPSGADSGFFLDENGTPRFRVGKEDTLGSIAQAHLGRFSRWTEIYRLNRQRLKDPNKMPVGTELQLPQDASRVRMVSAETIGR